MWSNYEVVGFQASVSDCSILRLCCLLLCTLPRPPGYSILHHSYYNSSSSHLGVPCLRPSISTCHTSSFAHLGVSRLRLSIPTSQPALPIPSGSYCVTFSPPLLILLSSHKISARVIRSCFSVASWHQQASLLTPPPPIRTLSPLYTLQIVYIVPPTVPWLPTVSLYEGCFQLCYLCIPYSFRPRSLPHPVS